MALLFPCLWGQTAGHRWDFLLHQPKRVQKEAFFTGHVPPSSPQASAMEKDTPFEAVKESRTKSKFQPDPTVWDHGKNEWTRRNKRFNNSKHKTYLAAQSL